MALQTINLGTYANDGSGDDLRTAFQKVNANLTELYNIAYGANIGLTPPTSGITQGELWWNTEDGRLYIYYGSAWIETSPAILNGFNISASVTTGGANLDLNGLDLSLSSVKFASGTNITVTRTNANTITFSSTTYTGNVIGNLTGNASTVTDGVYTTSSINALADVDTATSTPLPGQGLVWNGVNWVPGSVSSTGGDLDFGYFLAPAGFTLDLGTF